ncbi:MAG: hypothetical protein ACREMA_01985 [Longimicrobiales bacterium]
MKMRFLAITWLATAAVSTVQAQAPDTLAARRDSLLQANRYAITLQNGRLAGPGAEFLAREVRGTQFVLLGEPHNNRDVPAFTTALFRMLAEQQNYNYFAIESGSAMVTPLGLPPRAGNIDSVRAYVRRYPNGLQFASDQELDMIATIGGLSKARSTRVWGVDQEFGGLHALERLVTLAQTAEARALAQRVTTRASEYDAKRYPTGNVRYISRMAKAADFDSLAQFFRAEPGTEAAHLINALQTSHRIYQNNIFSRERISGYESNREREELMKTRFLEFYREAQTRGDTWPRVLVKLGHWHIVRGPNWGSVFSLGDFLTNVARHNDTKTLSIAMYLNNAQGEYGAMHTYPDYAYLSRAAGTSGWVLIDLRPLRRFVHSNRVSLNAEQARIVHGFDIALMLSGTEPANTTVIAR